ncbi:MAG: hypothetical protein QGI81_11105 [Pseudomonadales bacterium]|nr:hypothetical protein [Pseudomonadales bacterium]
MLKWIVLVVVAALVVSVIYPIFLRDASNVRIAEEIRAHPHGERSRRTMLITLADGRIYPVNYLREGNLVFMGIDGRWWRTFVGEGATVDILIRGEQFSGHAKIVFDDPHYKADVFSHLRPTVPKWLPDWLNAKLVVITLQE